MTGDATPGASTAEPFVISYRFGDLLALARRSWVRRMAALVTAAGFADYRRSDTFLVRVLAGDARPIGHIGNAMGVSRQAARKLAEGLMNRGYATLAFDPTDARRRLVQLTEQGRQYHGALTAAAELLNHEIRRLAPDDVSVADAVLRTLLTDEDREIADAFVPRPNGRSEA